MALVPITITAERELSIDFSKPFMDFSLSLIMQKAGEPPINNFAFLQPFTGGVWLSTIGVVSAVTIVTLKYQNFPSCFIRVCKSVLSFATSCHPYDT